MESSAERKICSRMTAIKPARLIIVCSGRLWVHVGSEADLIFRRAGHVGLAAFVSSPSASPIDLLADSCIVSILRPDAFARHTNAEFQIVLSMLTYFLTYLFRRHCSFVILMLIIILFLLLLLSPPRKLGYAFVSLSMRTG